MPSSAASSRPGSGTATPLQQLQQQQATAGPSKQVMDLNRPLAKVYFKPLAPFLPPPPYDHTDLSLPTLFDIPPQVYHSRLANRHLFLNANDPTDGSSTAGGAGKTSLSQRALNKGKKRSRGDEGYRAEVRRALDEQRKERERRGLVGERKRERELERATGRIKEGTVKRGMKVDYNAILPLHYLHTTYLAQLLSLPALPPELLSRCHSTTTTPSDTTPHTEAQVGTAAARTLAEQSLSRSSDAVLSHLSKASFLGANLSVRSSRNADLVGLSGICISETASTFAILPAPPPTAGSATSTVRIIPKQNTQLTLSYPAFAPPPAQLDADGLELPVDMQKYELVCPRVEVDLLGGNFGYRSGDRAGRKFRPAQGGGGGSGWGEEWVRGEWSGVLAGMEDGMERGGPQSGGKKKHRKKGKSRRKDPPSFGRILE